MLAMTKGGESTGAYLGRDRMAASGAHSLYRLLEGARFAFLYRGSFNEGLAPELIVMGEVAADQADRGKTHSQRLAFIMVEAFQNITRHRSDATDAECFFALRASASGEDVIAVNPVRADEVDALEQAIARLGATGRSHLKSLFLDRLRDGSHSARGGAGLGLIEMARRSGNGIQHRVLPLEQGHALFALHVPLGEAGDNAFDECLAIHRCARADGVLMALRCGGASLVQDAALRVLDREITDDASALLRAKRAMLAAFAWLGASGLMPGGLIAVGGGARDRWIELCWRAADDARDGIRERIAAVTGLSPFELERRYRTAVRGGDAAALIDEGLIELARISREPLAFAQGEPGDCDSLRARI